MLVCLDPAVYDYTCFLLSFFLLFLTANAQGAFIRGRVVGKISNDNAIRSTEVFDKPTMDAFMASRAHLFADGGFKHEIYSLNHIHTD